MPRVVVALCVAWFGACLGAGSIAAPSEIPAAKPLSFAILEDYDKGADLSEVERDFALVRELGITTWRGSFGWDDYEPAPGRFDFAWLHQFADLAGRHGLTLRPYLAYTPEWAGSKGSDADAWNNAPRSLAEWSRFAGAVAGALKQHPNVASFEVYNEENVKQWWDSTAARYADVLAAGARAVRRHNAGARVLFGGLVFPDAPWVTRVCASEAAREFDVLPVHAYPETWTPPGVTVENYLGGLSSFVEAADRACGRKAIWINETGFATVPGKSERDQAAWWVRAVATFAATPRVEHIGVYEIKDLPTDKPAIGDAPNYHLGLTAVDRSRKLAFQTMKMLVHLLDVDRIRVADEEAGVSRVEGEAGRLYVHLFERPDRDRVLTVWHAASSAVVAIKPERPFSSVEEYDLEGRATPLERTALDRLSLPAGVPRVFRLRGGQLASK